MRTIFRAHWRRLTCLSLGVLAFLGLAVAFNPIIVAQAPKAAPTPKTAPKAVNYDIPAGSQGIEQIDFIDQQITAKWEENKIKPADRCDDHTFIRRASLDIIGRIPKVHEIETYMKDEPRKRRSLLIERLLGNDPRFPQYAEEYADNWANIWTVQLLTRTGSKKIYQDQLRDWFADKLNERRESPKSKSFSYIPDWSKVVKELLSATGKTNENGAVNYILHHMGEENKSDTGKVGKYDFVPVTSRTTRMFLGLRTQCVQCHDHPFNGDWGQHHFWGVNAFFRQTTSNGRPMMMVKKNKDLKIEQQFTLEDDTKYNPDGLVSYERRNTLVLYTDASFLDGKKLDQKAIKAGSTRRTELAKNITKSPYFAKSFVNRFWAHFMGKSFTKDAPDDFGEHNPVSHPELLDKLAEDWATKYDHNPKEVIRWICNSRSYGLSSIANSTNDKPEDEIFFARMLLKSFSPEQLFESLMVATQSSVSQSKEAKIALREEWLTKLIVNFGDDEGNEGNFNGTVVQALMLMNGRDINEAITNDKVGTVANIIKKHGLTDKKLPEVLTDIYMHGLGRPPSDKEKARILSKAMISYQAHPELQQKAPQAFWTGFYQDVMWAVLNSNEFILNH